MIETLISSKTRIKLLLKFFLNSSTTSYLRSLEGEFGESSNAIRIELNRLEQAGMLSSELHGNKKYFRANTAHPLYQEVHNIVRKYVGIDRIVEHVIERLGDIRYVYLTGEFARGVNCDVIDLVLVGNVGHEYLLKLIGKAEELVNRRIRYIIYTDQETFLKSWSTRDQTPFLIWSHELNRSGTNV